MFNKTLALIFTLVIASQVCAVKKSDVKFFLHKPHNFSTTIDVPTPSFRLFSGVVWINPLKHVKILCHGYLDSHKSFWMGPTKNAFILKGEENIISVDWSKDATGLYSHSVKSVEEVGEYIAELVLYLHFMKGIALSNFHLIGHSLGSHISGYAGKKILAETGEKIGRITAMDPAGPSFNGIDEDKRLSKEDALFVDAIHTDTTYFGYKKPLAHADFWPNGGTAQVGCGFLELGCSHNRAPMYFYESINSESFQALECDSLSNYNKGKCNGNKRAVMGDNCGPDVRGNFYLNTNKESPFGLS